MRIYLYVILGFFLRLPKYAPIERELESRMMEKIPGLESARIAVYTKRLMFLLGRMKRLNVQLRGIIAGGGLRIECLTIEAEDLRIYPWLTFFMGRSKVRSAGEIQWNITIAQEDLEKFLASRGPLLRGTRVAITPERIELKRESGFTAALLDMKEPLFFAGGLEVRGADIYLDLHEVRAFGINPGRLLKPVLAHINPVLKAADLNRLLKNLSVDALEGLSLHNAFNEIRLYDGYAEVHSEMLVTKAKEKTEL